MTDIEKKEMRIKELKATIDVLRDECYVFNPLNLDRTIMINKALDVAIRELEKVIVALDIEPCEDCISREQAKAEIRKAFPLLPDRVDINSILNELPSVQPKPKTGHWIKNKRTFYTCDKCEFVNHYNRKKYNYCPNCGAKMESEV